MEITVTLQFHVFFKLLKRGLCYVGERVSGLRDPPCRTQQSRPGCWHWERLMGVCESRPRVHERNSPLFFPMHWNLVNSHFICTFFSPFFSLLFFFFFFFIKERCTKHVPPLIRCNIFWLVIILIKHLRLKKEGIEGFMIDKCSVHNSTARRPCTSDAYAHPYQSTPASQITSPYTLFVFIFFIIFFGA